MSYLGATVSPMVQIAQFINTSLQTPRSWPTGLRAVDEVTGGFRDGDLWVVTGEPRAGKSMLLTQLVHTLAVTHGHDVHYAPSTYDPIELTRNRLFSLATGQPCPGPGERLSLENLSMVEAHGREALEAAQLEIDHGGGFSLPRRRRDDLPQVLAVDDPLGKHHPIPTDVIDALVHGVGTGLGVLAAVPLSHVTEERPPDTSPLRACQGTRLREEWSAAASVIIEVVPAGPGDAVLRILQNRRGPTDCARVAVYAHRARFLELPESTPFTPLGV